MLRRSVCWVLIFLGMVGNSIQADFHEDFDKILNEKVPITYCDPEMMDRYETILHTACFRGYVSAVEKLLALHSINLIINRPNFLGKTPLYLALEKFSGRDIDENKRLGYLAVIKLLFRKGASPDIFLYDPRSDEYISLLVWLVISNYRLAILELYLELFGIAEKVFDQIYEKAHPEVKEVLKRYQKKVEELELERRFSPDRLRAIVAVASVAVRDNVC